MIKVANIIKILQVAEDSGWKTPNTLIWREPAQKIKPFLNERIYKNSCYICELDFSGIDTVDGSFIDELIVTELKKMNRCQIDKKIIYLSNLNDVTLYNVELVFTKKRPPNEKFYMLIKKTNNDWHLFSEGLEASLLEVLSIIMKGRCLTSNDIAKQFNISVPAASVRLKNLFDMRIVNRIEETTATGKEFVYESVF